MSSQLVRICRVSEAIDRGVVCDMSFLGTINVRCIDSDGVCSTRVCGVGCLLPLEERDCAYISDYDRESFRFFGRQGPYNFSKADVAERVSLPDQVPGRRKRKLSDLITLRRRVSCGDSPAIKRVCYSSDFINCMSM